MWACHVAASISSFCGHSTSSAISVESRGQSFAGGRFFQMQHSTIMNGNSNGFSLADGFSYRVLPWCITSAVFKPFAALVLLTGPRPVFWKWACMSRVKPWSARCNWEMVHDVPFAIAWDRFTFAFSNIHITETQYAQKRSTLQLCRKHLMEYISLLAGMWSRLLWDEWVFSQHWCL